MASNNTRRGCVVRGAPAVVPEVTGAPSPSVADTAGGGGRVVIPVASSAGCTAAFLGGVAVTAFAVDDATHVSGVPGARALGSALDVVVVNGTGPSTTGGGLFRYGTPAEIVGVDAYLDANKGVTDAGGGAVGAWLDQSVNARNFVQALAVLQPRQTAALFGTLPGLRFTPDQFVKLGANVNLPAGCSIFWVCKYTSTDGASTNPGINPPLTVLGESGGNEAPNAGMSAGQLALDLYSSTWVETLRGAGLNDGTARLVGWTVADDGTATHKAYVGATQQGADGLAPGAYSAATGYTSIGAGYADVDGLDGDIGAVVVVQGVIAGGDLTFLHEWARQRFGAAA